jgi:hypothetical protein
MAKQIFAIDIDATIEISYTKYVVAETVEEAKKLAEKHFTKNDVDVDSWDVELSFDRPAIVPHEELDDIDIDDVLTNEKEFDALLESILKGEEGDGVNFQRKVDREQSLKQLFESWTDLLGTPEMVDGDNWKLVLNKDGEVRKFKEFKAAYQDNKHGNG